MAPSWHQNRTDLALNPNANMNLCDIDMTSHFTTVQLIANQYLVAFDAGCTIIKEFKVSALHDEAHADEHTELIVPIIKDMMAHQSALAANGADEHDQYWELVWANLVSRTFYYVL